MYEAFGAFVDGSTVEFRVFFPDSAVDPKQYHRGGTPRIATLKVVGDFQTQLTGAPWDVGSAPSLAKNEHAKGWLYSWRSPDLKDDFYQYKYFVEFENGTTRWCGDPCSKYGGAENENAAFVVGGHSTVVKPIARRLPLQDLVLYELMVDDFTADFRGAKAPFDAIRDKLDYLARDLGVNAIQFMPWTAWPGGEFSWGYDPFGFFSVEHRYYNDPADPLDKLYRLQVLINELHERDIHVLMDGVFNHVKAGSDADRGFPYLWLYQNRSDSPYIGDFGEGGYFDEFDFGNECTAEFITDACKYWLEAYRIDGIRFDFVRGFESHADPPAGISRIVGDLNAYTASKGWANIALILELLPDNRYEAIGRLNRIKATGCWYDPLMWEAVDAGGAGHVRTSFVRTLNAAKDFEPGRRPVTYIENHDHSTVTETCGGRGRWWRTQPLAIALFTACGATMVHNGQEFGEQYWLPDHGDGRVMPRPVRWSLSRDGVGTEMRRLYRKLIEIRKAHPALRSGNFYPEPYDSCDSRFDAQGYGVDETRDVAIYHRWGEDDGGGLERFIVVLNLSGFDQVVDIPFPDNGTWEDLLNGGAADVRDYWLRNARLGSHWGRIYLKRG
jgi:1,4-alpha-glucan branching enzyme